MCIRDRSGRARPRRRARVGLPGGYEPQPALPQAGRRPGACLLYTSDAADDLLCVDLGGRRIIKKKNTLY